MLWREGCVRPTPQLDVHTEPVLQSHPGVHALASQAATVSACRSQRLCVDLRPCRAGTASTLCHLHMRLWLEDAQQDWQHSQPVEGTCINLAPNKSKLMKAHRCTVSMADSSTAGKARAGWSVSEINRPAHPSVTSRVSTVTVSTTTKPRWLMSLSTSVASTVDDPSDVWHNPCGLTVQS
jgi:hypothetical protein